MPVPKHTSELDGPPSYEVREKFNEEAYARWRTFTKGTPTTEVEADKNPDERTLEVPTFFRRRPWRR
jgi:hypothetical protein